MRRPLLSSLFVLAICFSPHARVDAQQPAPAPPPASTSAASTSTATPEVVTEIRVHGNHTTPDDVVLRAAGVTVGSTIDAAGLAQIEARLKASKLFASVEVRKRYRSLASTTDVVLILLVQENEVPSVDDIPAGPMEQMWSRLMFMPVLGYEDGYGLTYGVRGSFVDMFGQNSRLSVPLTWGGVKRAAVEVDKAWRNGVIHQFEGGFGVSSRENPHFRQGDRRVETWAAAIRRLIGPLRAGVRGGWTDVRFAGQDDRFTTIGLDLLVDTRHDPGFPRNAIYTRVAWDVLDPQSGPSVNRYTVDARGYLGVFGSTVLSVRGLYRDASAPLPAYEQYLLGGSSTLRGFRAGTFAGDRLLAFTTELRVPFTSPLNVGKTGFTIFADTGATAAHGASLRDAPFHRGFGGGLFVNATVFRLNLDVAYGVDNRVRVHIMSGFQF